MNPLVRRMFAVMFLMGAFWHIWNICAGEIPDLSSVLWLSETKTGDEITTPAQILTLPFGISRSWDVLGAAIFVWIFSRLKSHEKKNGDAVVGLISGLGFGTAFSLISFSVGPDLCAHLLIGLTIALLSTLLGNCMSMGLTAGLGYGVAYGLFWIGLAPGIVFFFIVTSPLWLMIGIRESVRRLWKIEWKALFTRLFTEPNSTS